VRAADAQRYASSRDPMKLPTRTLALFWLLIITAANAYPYSCDLVSQRKAFRNASAVFLGQAIEYLDNPNVERDGHLIVKFKVERNWKGTHTSEVIIRSEFGAVYGFHFEIGKHYLVYAYGKELFAPTVCARSAEIVDAKFAEYKAQQTEIAKLNNWWYRTAARVFPF